MSSVRIGAHSAALGRLDSQAKVAAGAPVALPAPQPAPKSKLELRLQSTANVSPSFTWKQFALMHNTSLIRFSNFDKGIYIKDSNSAYSEHLTYLMTQEPYFSLPNLQSLSAELLSVLKGLEDVRSCYPNSYFGVLDKEIVEASAKSILGEINKQLGAKKRVYFTFGYCGKKDGGSHALGCKVTQDDKNTTLWILNLGEGADHHPDVDVTSTHYKTSYAYYPVQIPNAQWQERAQLLFCHLIRYISDAPPEQAQNYSTVEIYDLLHLFGPLNPSLIDPSKKGKLQFVGDCSEKAVRNVLIDFLLETKKLSALEISKLFLNIHFSSFIAGFQSYKKAPSEHYRELLKHAASELTIALLRTKAYLNQDEFQAASDLITHVLDKCQPQAQAAAQQNGQAPPLSKSFSVEKPPQTIKVELEKCHIFRKGYILPLKLNPKTFKRDLTAWVAKLAELKGQKCFSIYEAFLNFPVPQYNTSDVWDQIPQADIKDILAQLQLVMKSIYLYSQVNRGLLLLFQIVFIADKLVRKTAPITNLLGYFDYIFSFKFQFQLFNCEQESFYLCLEKYFNALEKIKSKDEKKATQFEVQLLENLIEIAREKYFEQRFRVNGDGFHHQQQLLSHSANQVATLNLFELAGIQFNDPLKFGRALNWISANYQELHVYHVQHALNFCFFSCETISSHLKEVPAIAAQFREIVQKGLQFYGSKKEHALSAIYLIELATKFEGFQVNPCTNTLKLYKNYLLKILALFDWDRRQETHIYLNILMHIIYIDTFILPKTEEEFIEVYTRIFACSTGGPCENEFYREHFEEIQAIHFKNLETFCQKGGSSLRIGQRVLQNLKCEKALEHAIDWLYSDITITNGFKLQKVYSNSNQGELYWWCDASGQQALSLDGSRMLLQRREAGYITTTVINVKDSNIALFDETAIKELPFLNAFDFEHSYVTGTTLVSTRKGEKEPFWTISFTNKKASVQRKNLLLVNLKELDPKHPHYWLCQLAKPEEILCFVNPLNDEIEELFFLNVNLSFKKNGQHLESKEYPGYFVSPQVLPSLGNLSKEALILRGPHGKYKVLLFFPRVEKKVLDERAINQPKDFTYAVYDLENMNGQLVGKTLSERLFLIYFLKAHGLYELAMKQLQELPRTHLTFDQNALLVLFFFARLTDYCSHSLAFNMKLLLFVTNRFSQLAAGLEESAKEFCQIAANSWYVDYLRVMQEETLGSIAKKDRLTEAQEGRILSTLIREGINVHKILVIRDKLIHSISRSATVTFLPDTVVEDPSIYLEVTKAKEIKWQSWELPKIKDVAKIDYPNRLSANYLIAHFVFLFNEAKKGASFDYTLLAVLKVKLYKEEFTKVATTLAEILFYVRHFPDKFSDLDGKNIEAIVERLKTIPDRIFIARPLQIVFPTNLILATAEQKTALVKLIPANVFEGRAYQLLTQQEYDGIKATLPTTTTVMRFNNEVSVNGFREALFHQKTVYLPPKLPIPPLFPATPLKIEVKPFEKTKKVLFKEMEANPLTEAPLFEERADLDLFEKELIEKYKKAQGDFKKQKKVTFAVQPAAFATSKTSINQELAKIKVQRQDSGKKIDRYLNDPCTAFGLPGDNDFKMSLQASQTYLLSAELIMRKVILRNDCTLLATERPMLTPEHMRLIVDEIHLYYHLQVLEKMHEEAAELIARLEKGPDIVAEKELFDLLNYEFLLPPEKYPEIGYFKLKAGKLPRPEQALTYKWICEGLEINENRLFQTRAGGGKTSWFVPHLFLRCQRYKMMPVVFSIKAIHKIEKQSLRAVLQELDEDLIELDISMQSQLTLIQIQRIHDDIKDAISNRVGLCITPDVYYALRLNLHTHPDQAVRLIIVKIMLLFKNYGLQLIDESHRNLDPHTQAIFGVGQYESLTKREKTLLFELMRPYIEGKVYDDNFLATLLLKPQDMALKATILNYIRQKEAPDLQLPAHFSASDRFMILLTRHFIQNLLPSLFQLKTDYDHVASIEQGEIDTPAHFKTPSHAEFSDPYRTFALSIKGTFARGLSLAQVYALIVYLQESHLDEAQFAVDGITPSAKTFKEWTNKELNDVNFNDSKAMTALHNVLKRHPEAIEVYLKAKILNQIGSTSEQFGSTPQHLVDFKCTVAFSATPHSLQSYPTALKKELLDEAFEAEVLATATKKENQNFLKITSVDHFFAVKDNLKGFHVLIDAGGFLCKERNEDVATKWLAATDLEAILYFNDDDNSFALLQKIAGGTKVINLKKSNLEQIKEELKKEHGISWETLKVGTYYDAAHAEAANIPQNPGTKALVFADLDLTLSHAIQAIMRLRGFLDEKMNQTIAWALPPTLHDKATTKLLFTQFLKNEAAERKDALLLAAFQELSAKIEKAALGSCKEPLDAIKKHEKGFKESQKPQDRLGTSTKMQDSDQVLWDFARKKYAGFAFERPLDEALALKADLAHTISATKAKIAQIAVDFQKNANSHVQQKSHRLTLTQSIHIKGFSKKVEAEPTRVAKPITALDYAPFESARAIFKAPQLSSQLFVEANQIFTATVDGVSLKEKFLKPIDFLLVTIHAQKFLVEAVSNDIMAKMIFDMQECNAQVPHKAMVLRANGALYQKGKGKLAPTEAEVTMILASPEMEDVVADVSLLNGKVPFSKRFTERLKQWPDFPQLRERILMARPAPTEYRKDTFDASLAMLPVQRSSLLLGTNN